MPGRSFHDHMIGHRARRQPRLRAFVIWRVTVIEFGDLVQQGLAVIVQIGEELTGHRRRRSGAHIGSTVQLPQPQDPL